MKIACQGVPRIRARHASAVVGALGICAGIAACKDTSSPAALTPSMVLADGSDTLTGVVGTVLGTEIAFRVFDVNLRAVPNVTVTFTVSPADGATLSPTSATTSDSGFARTTATLGTVAGVATVIATVANVSSAVVFLVANPDSPSQVAAVSGDQQTAAAGTLLPDSLVARVADQYGNPLAGVTVTWSTTGAGTLGVTTSQTDANGLVANRYTLAATPGTQSVVAQVSADVAVTFIETGQ